MLYIILVILLMNICSTIEDADRSPALKLLRKKSFAALVFSSNDHFYSTTDKKISCQWLSRLKYQSKICWKHSGLAEVLLSAKNLSTTYCREQFKYDQWKCSIDGNFFKKVYRETAFMYSLASSAVMFSIARACAEQTLKECPCGEHGPKNNSFQWGRCGDNVKHAKKFTRRFFQVKRKGDYVDAILKHNIETGIKVVLQKETMKCKCHGVSGTCAMNICYKHIESFAAVTDSLKSLYYSAHKVEPTNRVNDIKALRKKKDTKLLFLENDINYCPTTAERTCRDAENCATLCCGRGFYTTVMQMEVKNCACRWCGEREAEPYKVCCQSCLKNETVFKCI